MLSPKAHKVLKELLKNSGLKFSNLDKDDILSFSRTRVTKDINSFLKSVNKVGFQYKTISDNGSTASIRVFPKGKKPSAGTQSSSKDKEQKNTKCDRASYIKRGSTYFADDEVIRTTLAINFTAWDELKENYDLVWNVRDIAQKWLRLTKDVSSFQWLFEKVDEQDLVDITKAYIDSLIKFKEELSLLLNNENRPISLVNVLKLIDEKFTTLISDLDLESHYMVQNVKNALGKNNREATVVEDIKPLFPFLERVWVVVREILLTTFPESIKKGNTLVKKMTLFMEKSNENSVNEKLSSVQKILKESCQFSVEDRLRSVHTSISAIEKISGKIPSFRVNRSIKVAFDDCPDINYPTRFTKISDMFAYCQYGDKKCPYYSNNIGSYINCKLLGQKKYAGVFLDDITKVDKETAGILKVIAKDDPQVTAIFLRAEMLDKVLYCGEMPDNRLLILLDNYPNSVRRGEYDYIVYIFENEPILALDKFIISANLDLLKQLNSNVQIFQW